MTWSSSFVLTRTGMEAPRPVSDGALSARARRPAEPAGARQRGRVLRAACDEGSYEVASSSRGTSASRRRARSTLVPGSAVAGVLHADVVLIGEEVGHAVIDRVLAEHRARGRGALLERVGPVLDAQAPEERVVVVSDIP